MTRSPSRRAVLAGLGALASGLLLNRGATAAGSARVVILGAGVAGVTIARQLGNLGLARNVTLIDQNPGYHACFKSNEALTGWRSDASLEFDYSRLPAMGIRVVRAQVAALDLDRHRVLLAGSHVVHYDQLVICTGIDFDRTAIPGCGADAAEQMPHAWSGARQYGLLKQKLAQLPSDGLVVIATPPGKFRCPPGPYERASVIASYMQTHKPRAKVLIADAQVNFSKQALFTQSWSSLHGFETSAARIERISGADGGRVVEVDSDRNAVRLENGNWIKADLVNLIPPQNAGPMLIHAGLADESGWCPVNKKTLESTRQPGVYVVGDAADVSPMPKSAFSAYSQAEVCALAIAASLTGGDYPVQRYANVCYSMLAPELAISISMVYGFKDNELTILSGGTTPQDATAEDLRREAQQSESWFRNMTDFLFG
ncbi:NAD(P)/FAD-dependent oxidoreductase [Burkholderia ubonensis]|uniref:NAD(P)/FAD-dependent oxidoreductase n=1 Tax=Burkholderia ubonensis TaxID=101571 RepID=UPI00075E2476|nr:NAD(P)/FAD-dependent oxidoreductase [Burkholderia ubonensis]